MASSSNSSRTSFEAKLVRSWCVVCILFGAGLCLSQLLEIKARSALRGYDNTFNYLWLRSAMVDGDWDFRNDLEQCDTLVPEHRASALSLPHTAAGRIPNKYGIGWAVLTLPFYLIADLLVTVGRSLNFWTYQNDGFNPVYQVCIQIGHSALACVALFLAARVVAGWSRQGRGRWWELGARESEPGLSGKKLPSRLLSESRSTAAWPAVVAIWAASPLVYYQFANVSMSHSTAFFVVTLLGYALSQAHTSCRPHGYWLLAGAAWGFGVTVRYPLAVFALPVAWSFYRWHGQVKPRRWWAGVLVFVTGAVPFLVLQSYAWHSVYGEWLVFSYGAEGESFHWENPAVWNSLFSSWHGLFYWHPFLLIGVGAMFAWAWRVRSEAIAWTVSFALIFYTNAAWWCWWFASSFGNRSYDAALLPVMGGTAYLLERLRGRTRMTFWLSAIACGFWNFYIVLLYRTGAISRYEPVTWAQMIDAASRLNEAVKF